MMRRNEDQGSGEHDALWRALCDRVYPMRDAYGVGDARHRAHQDLRFMTDMDLELDKLRVRFRVCLEADFPDRMWLLERIDKIENEQAQRAEEAWPPRDPVDIPARPPRAPEGDPPQPPGAQAQKQTQTREHPNNRVAAAEPARPRLGHVGYHMGREEMAQAVRAMLEKLDRQADILAEGWRQGQELGQGQAQGQELEWERDRDEDEDEDERGAR